MSSKTKELGTIGELQFATEAMKNGFRVFKELGDNSDVDLILLKDGNIIKIQVKSTEKIHDDGTMQWTLFKSRQNSKIRRKEFYNDNIDGFGLYCLENNYIGYIPKIECNSKYTLYLRIHPAKNNQSKNMKFSTDFTLNKTLN